MAVARMAKDNFWNKKRVENNMQYKDLVDLFKGSKSRWGMYFSGQNMPPAGIVQKLCDLFGVEFNEGFAKFEEMHENWKATNGKVTYSTGEAEPRATRKRVKKVEKAEDAEVEKVEEGIDGKKNALMELLYKANVPYDVFRRAIDNLAIAEKIVYSKVDYDTFKAVEKILDGSYIKAEEVSDPWEI